MAYAIVLSMLVNSEQEAKIAPGFGMATESCWLLEIDSSFCNRSCRLRVEGNSGGLLKLTAFRRDHEFD